MSKQQTHICCLPDSILLQIFMTLDAVDVTRIAQVCQRWRNVAYDESIWRQLMYKKWKVKGQIAEDQCLWRLEYQRLSDRVPNVLSETLSEHTDEVLHVSFSHRGHLFSTTSKDCTIKVWNVGFPTTLKYSHDFQAQYHWDFTQFSCFNATDSMLLVSSVKTAELDRRGYVAILSITHDFQLLQVLSMDPSQLFGTWLNPTTFLGGSLEISLDRFITTVQIKAFEVENIPPDPEEPVHVEILAGETLFTFCSENASLIKFLTVVNPCANAKYTKQQACSQNVTDNCDLDSNTLSENFSDSKPETEKDRLEKSTSSQWSERHEINPKSLAEKCLLDNGTSDQVCDSEYKCRKSADCQCLCCRDPTVTTSQCLKTCEVKCDVDRGFTSSKLCFCCRKRKKSKDKTQQNYVSGIVDSERTMASNMCVFNSENGMLDVRETGGDDRTDFLNYSFNQDRVRDYTVWGMSSQNKVSLDVSIQDDLTRCCKDSVVTLENCGMDDFCCDDEKPVTTDVFNSVDNTLDGSAGTDQSLIYVTGEFAVALHQLGFKSLSADDELRNEAGGETSSLQFDADNAESHMVVNYSNQLIEMQQVRKPDPFDHMIDLNGHITGLCLSRDHRYLFVNCRPWVGAVDRSDPWATPELSNQIEVRMIDLRTMEVSAALYTGHKGLSPSTMCCFIFLDSSDDFVGSGSEDSLAYVWERHYQCVVGRLPHGPGVVNAVAFCPSNQEYLVTVSDDNKIKIWRSSHNMRLISNR